MGSLTFLIVISLTLGIGAWLFFVWSVKSGQYDDVEGPKHRMLDDDDLSNTSASAPPADVSPGGATENRSSKPPADHTPET